MDEVFDQERNHLLTQFAQLSHTSAGQKESYILDLFQFQYKYNETYREFCTNLNVNPKEVKSLSSIPYLPITAFKHHEVKTGVFLSNEVFLSSGTTSSVVRSKHFVRDLESYKQNTAIIWSNYFNPVEEYCFLALLPGYLEREGSSLVSMVDYFVSLSSYSESGFYLRDHNLLYEKLTHCKNKGIPTVLFGVTYALLDFIDNYAIDFSDLIIIETGGMKGNRSEISKEELHLRLKKGFNLPEICSEYGMTELLSQAYSTKGTFFKMNDHLKITIKQSNDPLSDERLGKPGIVSLMDLANVDSCAFIQTEDLGIVYDDGRFELLGRMDYADIRGCNLMIHDLA